MNYYNEYDRHAAEWLRELIAAGLIPPGKVDTRSITEVKPHELNGYTQHHFFCGIAGWSLALQLAGWPSTRPVWTGSCPCQPFSCAGKQRGTEDERHLWPVFFNLIRECRPQFVFGEQVASAVGHGWLDRVSADLEGAGYACGSAVLGAHSVGSPHIRQRLYWMANAKGDGNSEFAWNAQHGKFQAGNDIDRCGDTIGLADATRRGLGIDGCPQREAGHPYGGGQDCGLSDPVCKRQPGSRWMVRQCDPKAQENREKHRAFDVGRSYWSNAKLIPCADGKTRRIESGLEPLVNGIPSEMVPCGDPSITYVKNTAEARQMRLRGYGNAIVPQTAAAFITAAINLTQP